MRGFFPQAAVYRPACSSADESRLVASALGGYTVISFSSALFYGGNEHNRIFGWIGMGLGVYLGGRLFDLQGSYTTSFAFAMAMGLINLVILGLFALHIRSARITQIQHSM